MSYLPQIKGEVDAFVKKNKTVIIAIVLCGILACFCAWLWCRYYDRSAASDYRNVTDTVQQIESDNQSARSDIGHAAGSIDRATEQLDGATTALDQAAGTVTRLQESAAGNAAQLGECQRLVDESRRNIAEAKSIFADVDQANKSHGAQTGNH